MNRVTAYFKIYSKKVTKKLQNWQRFQKNYKTNRITLNRKKKVLKITLKNSCKQILMNNFLK